MWVPGSHSRLHGVISVGARELARMLIATAILVWGYAEMGRNGQDGDFSTLRFDVRRANPR